MSKTGPPKVLLDKDGLQISCSNDKIEQTALRIVFSELCPL